MRAHGSYHHAFEKISQDLISIINVYYVKRQGSALWPVRDLYRPQRPATLHHIRKHTTFIVTSHSLPLRLISSNIGYAIKGKSALLKTTTSSAIRTPSVRNTDRFAYNFVLLLPVGRAGSIQKHNIYYRI